MADELRAGNRPWFPRSSRNFSLGNITEDVTDWYYQSQAASEDRARQAAADAINPQLNTQEGSAAYRFDPQRQLGRYVEALVQDVSAGVPTPAAQETAGFQSPFQRPKLPQARQSGLQQAEMMEQMLAAYGKPVNGMFPSAWRQLPEELALDMYAYAANQDGYRDRLTSPTETTGVLGEGSPVNTALTWGQSLPSTLYAIGENVGNAADYVTSKAMGGTPGVQFPDAGKNLAYAANTLTAPGQAMAEAVGYAPQAGEGHSAWSDMKDTRQDFDAGVNWGQMGYNPTPYGTTMYDAMQYGGLSDEAQSVDLQEGKDYFMGQGVPETPAYFLGMATDDLFNPVFDAPGIAAASKSGKLLPIAKQIGIEFAPGQVMTGMSMAAQIRAKQLEDQARQDALIGRLR
jgi:hypothetical protein